MQPGRLDGVGIGSRTAIVALVLVGFSCPATATAGDASFTFVPGSLPGIGDGPVAVAAGDFNADGDLDLAVANAVSDNVSVLIGGPGTAFTAAPGSPIGVGDAPNFVATGDFNADGDEDLAVTNSGDDNLRVLVGGAGAGFTPGALVPIGDSPNSIAVGDFNADGNEDLAVTLSLADDEVVVLTGAGGAGFAVGTPISVSDQPVDLAVGDFNGDGDEDLAVANFDLALDILIGGAGTAFSGSTIPTSTDSEGVLAADFNGDSDDDLAVSLYNEHSVLLFTGGPGGSFAANPALDTLNGPAYFSIGDFNSDLDPDLALTHSFAGSLAILTGSPGVAFASGPGSPITLAGGRTAVGDFDADGNQDLAATVGGTDSVVILRGGGTPWNADNLLTAGGVEGPGAAASSATAPALPSPWVATGPMTFVRYGTFGDYPRIAEAASWEGGLNFFSGGPANAASSATQVVDVADRAASIDGGLVTARLAARLGGFRTDNDSMTATATFRDAAGATLGSFAIGPVTALDRANRTVLLPRSATQTVPAGTRGIEVRLDATRAGGVSNDGFADNVELNLETATPPAPPDPSPVDKTPPETEIDKGPAKKTEKSKAKLAYSADEPATFECRLKGRGVKKRLRSFSACDDTIKYKRLKPGKKKFQVRAVDLAGNIDLTPAKLKWKVLAD